MPGGLFLFEVIELKTKVEGGLLSSIADIIKSISSVLVKGLDYLYKIGIETKDVEQTADGGVKFSVKTPSDHEFTVTCNPVNGRQGYFNMEFKSKDGDTLKESNVKEDKLQDTILKVIEEWYGKEEADGTNISTDSNTRIKVGLQKVACDDGYEIQMTKIQCSTDIKSAKRLLDTVLADDEFVESIPEDETVYDLVDEPESIDVEIAVDSNCDCQPGVIILAAAINLKDDLQCIHWNALGRQFNNIHEYLNGPIDTLNEQIDSIAEYCVELYGSVPHSGSLPKESPMDPNSGFSNTQGFSIVREKMHDFIDCLELLYCNFSSDYQSVLDDWIRYWKKEADYFVARRLLSNED